MAGQNINQPIPKGEPTVKQVSQTFLAVLGALALMSSVQAQQPPDVSHALGLQSVKSIDIVKTNNLYHAFTTVVFENGAPQGYRFQEPVEVSVKFEYEGNKRRVKTGEEIITVTKADGTKETTKRETYTDVEAPPILLGNAVVSKALTFTGTKNSKEPKLLEQEFDIIIGPAGVEDTTDRIVKIANVMGNPSGTKFGMHLFINAVVSVEQTANHWVAPVNFPSKIELELKPQYLPEALFK